MSRRPTAVLYVCSLNRVRSPTAAGLARKFYGDSLKVESCGLEPADEVDALATAAMREVGVELSGHRPKALKDMRLGAFDLVVALSREAEVAVRGLGRDGAEVEAWGVFDPTVEEGSHDMRLEAYRQTRKELERRITGRFGQPPECA